MRTPGKVLLDARKKISKLLWPRNDFIRAENIKESDIFLVSYPRSGSTWVRAIIAQILYDESKINSLKSLNSLVPDIHVNVPNKSGKRVIKTHRPYPFRHEKENENLYGRVIYLARNPIDVAKSFYHYSKFQIGSFDGEFESFANKFSAGAIAPGNWQFHVLSWTENKDVEVCILRYEDLKDRTNSEIEKIAKFINKDISKVNIDKIRKRCSRDRMIKLEEKGSLVDESYNFISNHEEKRVDEVSEIVSDSIKERNKFAMNKMGYK